MNNLIKDLVSISHELRSKEQEFIKQHEPRIRDIIKHLNQDERCDCEEIPTSKDDYNYVFTDRRVEVYGTYKFSGKESGNISIPYFSILSKQFPLHWCKVYCEIASGAIDRANELVNTLDNICNH